MSTTLSKIQLKIPGLFYYPIAECKFFFYFHLRRGVVDRNGRSQKCCEIWYGEYEFFSTNNWISRTREVGGTKANNHYFHLHI